MTNESKPSSGTGLRENVAALLCYVLGWVTGIIFLIIEPNNKVVRFHAIQSIIVFGTFTVVNIIFGWIPVAGWILNTLLGIAGFVLWIILMLKAYQGGTYHLPVAGELADRFVK